MSVADLGATYIERYIAQVVMEKEILIKSFSDQISKELGSTMVEYAMMVALVAAGCIVSIRSVGSASNEGFVKVWDAMANGGIEPVLPGPPP